MYFEILCGILDIETIAVGPESERLPGCEGLVAGADGASERAFAAYD
jgi:hypothetical protein